MNNFRRILAFAIVMIMIVISLVGCGSTNSSDNNSKDGKEKLTVWLPPIGEDDKAVWEPILKEFEEENNVEIDLGIIPWEGYPEKYATAIAAGEGPDIGYMYAEMFPQFIEMGAVEDLTPYLTDKDYENYIYIEDGKMLGGLYGLAIEAANPAVLYYNKDILEELGEEVPKTWEDFRRIAKKATKDTDGDGKIDQWGFAQGWGANFFGDLNWNWYGFLWQAGGELYNDDLKTVRFNDEAGLEAAQFLYNLKFIDKVLPDNAMAQTNKEMLQTTFGPGKAAFSIWLSSAASEILDKSFPDLNYGFITSLENKDMGTFASVDQLTLMSATKNKELAFKLMQHMLSAESMIKFHKYHPRAPISKDEPYQGDPRLKEMIYNDKGIYRPLVVAPHGVEVYEYLWKQLQRMMAGEVKPKEALDEAARYANDLLAQD
ncbi:ABC transporter substrate-binding protein [Tepidibacter formicigenes]|jgi:ABC-type glycerol-3-phosphate transport system substrate-binding protein|uniref:ABC-type glycerol-3-phosphate transport system, substrate-binding protein n=1 Tax=Tepidibacter formicigenes DSM 15518 TaxID=1123349 RepID=A0A1M6KIW8_9FIRM|nr:sugar ABC transporter substrate-binding protein [Tepidibacter formicigenes]SHJ58791.1 ABC-type glycerol-3-phosphate transport system, substrate-binding protein [Tepidibacter formicigenes DSM 15518]